MANSITVPAPPLSPDVSAALLAFMSAQSGVLTDYNVGSQIRTLGEAIGSVVEIEEVVINKPYAEYKKQAMISTQHID